MAILFYVITTHFLRPPVWQDWSLQNKLCHKWSRVCTVCHYCNPVLSAIIIYNGMCTGVDRQVSVVEQELLNLWEQHGSFPICSEVHVVFCFWCNIWSIAIWTCFLWPMNMLNSLSFFELRLLVNLLLSSNFSYSRLPSFMIYNTVCN